MKKIIVCFVCVILIFCTACGETKSFSADTTCEQILNAATTAASYNNTKTYIKNNIDLDVYTMSMWSDGLFDECKEFELLADYAICYSNDNNTYEISVLKANSKNDIEKLTNLFERRKKTLSEGDKAAYDPNFKNLIDDSRIITNGEFVILLITPSNDAVIKAIENLK